MKNKFIISTILRIVLLFSFCFIAVFAINKLYNKAVDNSMMQEEKKYITINTSEYKLELLDYYLSEKFFYDGATHGVSDPFTFLVLRLKITNTSDKLITLTNDYKLTYGDKTYDFEYAINNYRLNIEPSKYIISNVAYDILKQDNVNEYFLNFNGEEIKLIIE